ncbi:MAG: hypothetical protein DRN99_09370 [Thermoproteota archaeon]|nr:MAG: hypothetical protein DRN99_09370 [Candidatus Korarchaeota archaeon]
MEHGVKPSKVILLHTLGSAKVARDLRKVLPHVLQARVELKQVNEEDVESAISTVEKVAKRELEAGRRVIVDITGGRKTMSAALFAAASKLGLEVYYLHLRDQSYMNKLYPLVPRGVQKLVKLR